MKRMALQFQRIVTGHLADGTSCFLYEGEAASAVEQIGRGLKFFELWETDGPLASNEGNEDAGNRAFSHHPPKGGTRFRIVEFLPDSDHSETSIAAEFASMDVVQQVEASDDPTMHRNETVDYNIILSGEIYAVTERGERLLRAGDVIVQRGTAHTWRNRSNKPCVFASIMVSAEPLALFTDAGEGDA